MLPCYYPYTCLKNVASQLNIYNSLVYLPAYFLGTLFSHIPLRCNGAIKWRKNTSQWRRAVRAQEFPLHDDLHYIKLAIDTIITITIELCDSSISREKSDASSIACSSFSNRFHRWQFSLHATLSTFINLKVWLFALPCVSVSPRISKYLI